MLLAANTLLRQNQGGASSAMLPAPAARRTLRRETRREKVFGEVTRREDAHPSPPLRVFTKP